MKKQHFIWKAVDRQGAIRRGIWVESDIAAIQRRLRNEGCFPVAVHKIENPFRGRLLLSGSGRWSDFARRLAVFLEAGVPLLQALEIMTGAEQKATAQMEEWREIKEQIKEGRDLSEVMAASAEAPDDYVIALIKAGEQAGTLGKTLSDVAKALDQEAALQKKIKTALSYPLLLFIAVFIVLYVLSVWVLPMYEQMFADMSQGAELPILTRVIFVCGSNLPVFFWSVLGLVAGFLLLKIKSPEQWRKRLRRLPEKIPVWGKICCLRDLAQFSGLLGRLLTAGIPLLEALQLTAGVLRSGDLEDLSRRIIYQVRQGRSMAQVLRSSPVFPKEAVEMVAIGEETGQLERMINYVAELLQRELDERLNRLTRLLEPALILAAAGLIGLVAAGVMLPIFDLSTQMQ